MNQSRSAEGFSMPSFDDDYCPFDGSQIHRAQHEGQRLARGLRMWVHDEKINIIILLPASLANELAMLPNEELVQLEIFANDCFANGGHVGNEERWSAGALKR